MINDTELLRCHAETRDERAFTELVQRRFDGVYYVALRGVGGLANTAILSASSGALGTQSTVASALCLPT